MSTKKTTTKSGKRYSDEVRSNLLAKYLQLRKEGVTIARASKSVGVPYITLRTWERKAHKITGKPGVKTAARKVLKKATALRKSLSPKRAMTGGITLITPAGFRVEGISSTELLAKILIALK